MDAAIKSAEVYGIGMASVAHSHHFGMSAWVIQQAIDANMMSLVFTKSSPTVTVKSASPEVWFECLMACSNPEHSRLSH
jgi:LDH2 family malate/lactate/ureidoglycolate dehydrogenase